MASTIKHSGNPSYSRRTRFLKECFKKSRPRGTRRSQNSFLTENSEGGGSVAALRNLQLPDDENRDQDASSQGNESTNTHSKTKNIFHRMPMMPRKFRLTRRNKGKTGIIHNIINEDDGSMNSNISEESALDESDLSFHFQSSMSLYCHGERPGITRVDHSNNLGPECKRLLAESRTPSFNVMLHSNEFYSDSCTLVKRKSIRITWDDLEKNVKILEEGENVDNAKEEKDDVSDIKSTGSFNSLGGSLRSLSLRSLSNRSLSRNLNRSREARFIFTPRGRGNGSDSTDIGSNSVNSVLSVRKLQPRGSLLVMNCPLERQGSNKGGVAMWAPTSTIAVNEDFDKFVLYEKTKEWLKHFKTCDPRFRILTFFNDVANEGATGDSADFERDHVSPLLKYFSRASVFTVWRPTSLDAIRRMMLGQGVGKGLDIKGKSAKKGKLSAFVPFLQIFQEEDKEKVRTPWRDSKIRVFFNSRQNRDHVVERLKELGIELMETVEKAKHIIANESQYDDETVESAMEKMTLDMDDPMIGLIDTYSSTNRYGMEIQERLFWEGMVIRQNIHREPGSRDDTGRTSMPTFQDMNFASLRKKKNNIPGGCTRAVIMQYNAPGDYNNDPMSPLNLVMAYEENDPGLGRLRVIPCVSDFDCFIVGTRGVRYQQEVPADQIEIFNWMLQQTESILQTRDTDSWTKRWLNVLKDCGNKGFHPEVPPLGYSDPKTNFIFEHAIQRLSITGAVRHGAECYNYFFPQELDEKMLVISDELPEKYNRCNWVYVNQKDLQDILKYKIERGYTFPLNPKWVLCDPGWKDVYDKLLASQKPNVQNSLNCFYPPTSGIRENIERIHQEYPDGFQRIIDTTRKVTRNPSGRLLRQRSGRMSFVDGTMAMDLAEQELKYYMVLSRAKKRLKVYLIFVRLLGQVRERSRRKQRMLDKMVAQDFM